MHKPETPKPVDPVAFMPAEDTFTPPKEPSPMQLAQQETLGAYFGAILINTSNETETRNSIIIVDLPTTFASVLDLPEQWFIYVLYGSTDYTAIITVGDGAGCATWIIMSLSPWNDI